MELFFTILIYVLVLTVMYYLIDLILKTIPAPEPISKMVRIIFLIMCLILLISFFFGWDYPRIRIK